MKTTCAMDLLNFPFDSQECRIQIASCKLADTFEVGQKHFIVEFSDGQWKTMVDYAWSKKSPFQTGTNLSLPDGFRLASISNDRCDVRTLTGKEAFFNCRQGVKYLKLLPQFYYREL